MKLSHYIKELLFEHEYVIIPGFGAFVSNYKPAWFEEEKGIFHPPSKDISFNSKLKNNDGLLIKYISDIEGITDLSANKKIEKERENILYQLDNGEKVEIVGVGFLFMDTNKQICFDSAPEDNLLIDSFGLEATSLHEEKVEPVKEVVITESQKPKKKRKFIWLWLVFILLIIAAIFIYLNYKYPPLDTVLKEIPAVVEKDTSSASQEINQLDTIVTDSISSDTLSTEAVKEDEIETQEVETQDGPVYYLIGGSFGVKANADKYFNRIKALGYEPVHLGKQRNLFVVAVEKYSSLVDAENAQRKFLSREPNSGVWIMPIDN